MESDMEVAAKEGDPNVDETPTDESKKEEKKSKEKEKKSKDKDDKKKKKKKEKVAANSMADATREVEERLKAREQIKLTIVAVEVNNLPSAHRFTRNMPWIKGAYGEKHAWAAPFVDPSKNSNGIDYVEPPSGDKANWKDLDWAFNLGKN